MALEKAMATGREDPCYKCGSGFKPGELKVSRPTMKHKGVQWVHEKCGPDSLKRHGGKVRRR